MALEEVRVNDDKKLVLWINDSTKQVYQVDFVWFNTPLTKEENPLPYEVPREEALRQFRNL